jgi:hypothetical protein
VLVSDYELDKLWLNAEMVVRFACLEATVTAILVIQLYDQGKISHLKLMRDDVAAQLKELC